MFLLFSIRQQFSSLTASHSWRLFLVVCCLLGLIDATSINKRAVFSEKSFCKPCSQSLQSGGGNSTMKLELRTNALAHSFSCSLG